MMVIVVSVSAMKGLSWRVRDESQSVMKSVSAWWESVCNEECLCGEDCICGDEGCLCDEECICIEKCLYDKECLCDEECLCIDVFLSERSQSHKKKFLKNTRGFIVGFSNYPPHLPTGGLIATGPRVGF